MELFKKILTSEELPPDTRDEFICGVRSGRVYSVPGRWILEEIDYYIWWMKPVTIPQVLEEEGNKFTKVFTDRLPHYVLEKQDGTSLSEVKVYKSGELQVQPSEEELERFRRATKTVDDPAWFIEGGLTERAFLKEKEDGELLIKV